MNYFIAALADVPQVASLRTVRSHSKKEARVRDLFLEGLASSDIPEITAF